MTRQAKKSLTFWILGFFMGTLIDPLVTLLSRFT